MQYNDKRFRIKICCDCTSNFLLVVQSCLYLLHILGHFFMTFTKSYFSFLKQPVPINPETRIKKSRCQSISRLCTSRYSQWSILTKGKASVAFDTFLHIAQSDRERDRVKKTDKKIRLRASMWSKD